MPFVAVEFYHDAAHYLGAQGLAAFAPAWLRQRLDEAGQSAAPLSARAARRHNRDIAELAAIIRSPQVQDAVRARIERLEQDDRDLAGAVLAAQRKIGTVH